MQLPSTKYRSSKTEIMDDFDFQGEELKSILKDLENINQWLGGNLATLNGIKKLISTKNKTFHIADIGCGNGAMLREIAQWGRKNGLKLKLTGIDANEHTVQIARQLSKEFPEISFKTQNVFDEDFKKNKFDIVSCCLLLHHFKTPEIKLLLESIKNQVELGIVINDLHRSKFAYYLFHLFCVFFVKNKIAKNDGLISIHRGFKRTELKTLARELQFKNYKITWFWAFRYQFLISITKSSEEQP